MDVYFDFELNDYADQPEDPKHLVYETLRQFVQTRYKVLDEELYANCTEDDRPFGPLWTYFDAKQREPLKESLNYYDIIKNVG